MTASAEAMRAPGRNLSPLAQFKPVETWRHKWSIGTNHQSSERALRREGLLSAITCAMCYCGAPWLLRQRWVFCIFCCFTSGHRADLLFHGSIAAYTLRLALTLLRQAIWVR